MHRIIKFKKIALLNPSTYTAMLNDKAIQWAEAGPNCDQVEIQDSEMDNFPQLRKELTLQKASYDFFQVRQGESDHTTWQHGREGASEVDSQYGDFQSNIKPLHECQR
jgi:hypothetical protein